MGKLTALPSRLGSPMVKLAAAPKAVEPFYQSPEWRGLVARLKSERGNWCNRCGARGRIIGDHIVERKDGGAELDETNVELLCQRCHNRKTAAARGARAGIQIGV